MSDLLPLAADTKTANTINDIPKIIEILIEFSPKTWYSFFDICYFHFYSLELFL